MSSNSSEAKTYVDRNHAFLQKVLSQPSTHTDAEHNKRAFLGDFAGEEGKECFPPEALEAMDFLLPFLFDGVKQYVQYKPKKEAKGNELGRQFQEFTAKVSQPVPSEKLEEYKSEYNKQCLQMLQQVYDYIFDEDGNYNLAFQVKDKNGEIINIDQFLAERGLTKRDLFWQYVQTCDSITQSNLFVKIQKTPGYDDYDVMAATAIFKVMSADFSLEQASYALFEEKFFRPSDVKAKKESKEAVKELSSQLEGPWPKNMRVCWLLTAQAEAQEQDKDFIPQKGIVYVNQLTSGNLNCFYYIDKKGNRIIVKVPVEHFSPKPPAQKNRALNQFCERLGRLKQTRKDNPFSAEDSVVFLNSMASFLPVVSPAPVKSVAKKKPDFKENDADENKSDEVEWEKMKATRVSRQEIRGEKFRDISKESNLANEIENDSPKTYIASLNNNLKSRILNFHPSVGSNCSQAKGKKHIESTLLSDKAALNKLFRDIEEEVLKELSSVIYYDNMFKNLSELIDDDIELSKHINNKKDLEITLKQLLKFIEKQDAKDYSGDGWTPEQLKHFKKNLEVKIENENKEIGRLKYRMHEIFSELKFELISEKVLSQEEFDGYSNASNEERIKILDKIKVFKKSLVTGKDRVDGAAQENLIAYFEPKGELMEARLSKLVSQGIIDEEIVKLYAEATNMGKVIILQRVKKNLENRIKEQESDLREKIDIQDTIDREYQALEPNITNIRNAFYIPDTSTISLEFQVLERVLSENKFNSLNSVTLLRLRQKLNMLRKAHQEFMDAKFMVNGEAFNWPTIQSNIVLLDKLIRLVEAEILSQNDFCDINRNYEELLNAFARHHSSTIDENFHELTKLARLHYEKKVSTYELVLCMEKIKKNKPFVIRFIQIAENKDVIKDTALGTELLDLLNYSALSEKAYLFARAKLGQKDVLVRQICSIARKSPQGKKEIFEGLIDLLITGYITDKEFIDGSRLLMTPPYFPPIIETGNERKEKTAEILLNILDKVEDDSNLNLVAHFVEPKSLQELDEKLLQLCHLAIQDSENRTSFFDEAMQLLELRASAELKETEEYKFFMQYKEVKKGIKANSNNIESRLLTKLNTTMRQFYTLAQELPAAERSEGYTVVNSLVQERKPNPKAEGSSKKKEQLENFQKKMEAKSTLGKKISGVAGMIRGLALMAAGVAAGLSVALIAISVPIFKEGFALFKESKSKWNRACKEEKALKALSKTVVPQLEEAARPNTLAFFDVDKTCIQWDGTPSQAAEKFKKDFAQTVALTARDKKESLKNFNDAFLNIAEEIKKVQPNTADNIKAYIKKRIADLEQIKLKKVKEAFEFETIYTLRDLENKEDGTPYGLGNYYSVLEKFENTVYTKFYAALDQYVNSVRFTEDFNSGVGAVMLSIGTAINQNKKALDPEAELEKPCSATKSNVIQLVLEQDKTIGSACLLDDSERHRILLECDKFNHPSKFTIPVHTVAADAEKKEAFTDEKYRKEYQAKTEEKKEKTHPLIPLTYSNNASSIFRSIGPEVLDHADEQGHTVLHHVALVGDIKAALFLMERVKDLRKVLEIKDKQGKTPLTISSANGENLLGVKDENGKTLLHLIVESGPGTMLTRLIDNIDLLIKNGSDINAKDSNGNTALDYAINKKEAQIIASLAEAGVALTVVAVEVKDDFDHTPLYYAVQSHQKKAIQALLKLDPKTASVIVLKGVEIDLQASLHAAAEHGNIEVIKALLTMGADVNAVNEHNLTALHLAAYFGKTEVVRTLIKAGASVSLTSKNDKTPLDYAIQEKNVEAIVAFVEAGAKLTTEVVQVMDSKGQTLLDYVHKAPKIDEAVKAFYEERKVQRKQQQLEISFSKDLGVRVSNPKREEPYGLAAGEHDFANDKDSKTYISSITRNIEKFCRDSDSNAKPEFRIVSRFSASMNYRFSQLDGMNELLKYNIELKNKNETNDQEKKTLEAEVEKQSQEIKKLKEEIALERASLIKKRDAIRNDLNDIYDLFYIRHQDGDILVPELKILDEFIHEKRNLSFSELLAIQEKLLLLYHEHIDFNKRKRVEFDDKPLKEKSFSSNIKNLKRLLKIVDNNIKLQITARLKEVDQGGRTILHEAAVRGHLGLIKTLIDLGADTTATDHQGKTPLDLLQSLRQERITSLNALLAAIDSNKLSIGYLKKKLLIALEYTEFGREHFALLKEDMRFWVLDPNKNWAEVATRKDFCKRYIKFSIDTIQLALKAVDLSVSPLEDPIRFLPKSKQEKYRKALQEKVEKREVDVSWGSSIPEEIKQGQKDALSTDPVDLVQLDDYKDKEEERKDEEIAPVSSEVHIRALVDDETGKELIRGPDISNDGSTERPPAEVVMAEGIIVNDSCKSVEPVQRMDRNLVEADSSDDDSGSDSDDDERLNWVKLNTAVVKNLPEPVAVDLSLSSPTPPPSVAENLYSFDFDQNAGVIEPEIEELKKHVDSITPEPSKVPVL